MPPDILSSFFLSVIFFPFLFSFIKLIHIFTKEVWHDFYYFIGLFLSLGLSLIIKKLLSYIFPGTGKFRLDMIINKFNKYVIDNRKGCHLFDQRFFQHLGILSLYMVFYGYSLVYFSFGKLIFDNENFMTKTRYISYIILFCILLFFHGLIQMSRSCVRFGELFLGILVGFGLGIAWYVIIKKYEWDDEVHYDTSDVPNNCRHFGNKFICYGKENDLRYGKKYQTKWDKKNGSVNVLNFDYGEDDKTTEIKEKTVTNNEEQNIGKQAAYILGITSVYMIIPPTIYFIYDAYNK